MSEKWGSDVRRRQNLEEAGWLLAMFLPGALTVFLGFRSGGFYVGATSLAAAEMALVVSLRFALARRPLQGVSKPLAVAVVAMACFCAWTLLSANWSHSVSRALPEYSRALLYGLTLLFFGMLPFNVRRIRWMVYGVAAAAVAICTAALIARLLPHVIFDPTLVSEHRLGYPLTYWNALGILACVGAVLCAHLACSTRDSWIARVLGAAAVPLFALTLLYTLSRGGIWAAAGALVVYTVVGRPRALISGAIATVPTTLIALAVATPTSTITESYPNGMVAEGKHVALVLAGCMLGAGLLRASLLPLDGWLVRLRLPERARRPVLAGTAAIALVLVLAAATAANAPHAVQTKYHEFTDRTNTSPAAGEARLLSARPENRLALWHVALDAYRENQLHGAGAGTYAERWDRYRPISAGQVLNAHSLYLEVLGELGLVGLVVLLVAIALIIGSFAYRARGPDRALFAALLACGLAWAVHAGVDWDWQMPAVTLWLFAFGGAALARSLRRRRRSHRAELRRVAMRIAGVLACLGLAILPARVAISQARLDSAIDAMRGEHCQQARAESRSALSVLSQRPTPDMVIAYCDMVGGSYRGAVAAMGQARARDPLNWEVYYGLALARAAAGLDPRAAASEAAKLNPGDPRASTAPRRLHGDSKRAWIAAGRSTVLVEPSADDP